MSDAPVMETLSKSTRCLALALCAYLAAPLFDLPVLGLSLSAPLIFILTYEILNNRSGFQPRRFARMIGFLTIFVFGLLLSLFWNTVFGDLQENFSGSLKYVLHFSFWGFSALLACRLFSLTSLPGKAGRAFALGISVMSVFVLSEYLILGGLKLGWSQVTTLSQNSYAVQFSAFLPFVYAALAETRGRGRLFWTTALALCLAAVVMNSSRSGWGTTLVTLAVFCSLYAAVLRRFRIAFVVVCLGLSFALVGWSITPESIRYGIERDFQTFENLQRDKSWMIRQLQIQKGLKLFEQGPLFGIGPGQFRFRDAELELPDILRNRSQSEFNDRSAHNSYIQFLAEGGLLFMIPFGLFLTWLAVAGMRAAVQLCRFGETWGLALYSGFLGMSIHFWTLSGLTSTAPWFLYGMMAAMIYRVRWLRYAAAAKVPSPKESAFATRLPLPQPR